MENIEITENSQTENIEPNQVENQPENNETSQLETTGTAENKLNKIREYPKRKFAIIHGYNGHHFCGNQKNPNVRTVEEEMENTFYKLNYISECNYGVLQKIGWMRASRTDKKVSAIFNVVSCKLHRNPDMDEEEMKRQVNEALPKDIKIFRMIEVSRSFDSKGDNNHRVYHYILPTFMLDLKPSENGESTIDNFVGNYNYRLTPELHSKLRTICKYFKGTRKYHNYTKKLSFSDASCNRHIYELSCEELFILDKFEAIKFTIVGQSFLYNQIRKMIGSIIEICRESRDMAYLENSFLSNRMDVPKAPAEGLYLYKIDYSKYNIRKPSKKNSIFITEKDEKEMEDFRVELTKHIHDMEVDERVFSKWLWRFDNQKENIY